MERARGPILIAAASALFGVVALVHQFSTPVDASMGWAFRGFTVVMGIPYALVGLAIRFRAAWLPMFGLSMFVFLLIPNGRFTSPRWRKVSYFAVFSIAFTAAAIGISILRYRPYDIGAVRETMQPAHVSVWTRGSAS